MNDETQVLRCDDPECWCHEYDQPPVPEPDPCWRDRHGSGVPLEGFDID